MATTIQISKDLQSELGKRKMFDNETYEGVIWSLIEDTTELLEETKRNLAQSRAEIKAGKSHTLEEIKKELKL